MPPPPPAQPSPNDKPSWWKRKLWKLPTWAWITIAVVVLLGAAGAAGGSDDDKVRSSPPTTASAVNDATTTTVAESDEGTGSATSTQPATTTAAPTTTQPPTTTTEPATTTTTTSTTTTTIPPPPVEWSGAGDEVVEIGEQDRVVLVATHDGSRNFIVTGLDADLQRTGGVINEIGTFFGSVLIDDIGDTRYFQVAADGNWTLSLLEISQLRSFPDAATGAGKEVLMYTGDAAIMHLTHNGERNFIVRVINEDGGGSVVNEIGPYDGSVPFVSGPAFVEVNADGDWSIAP